MKDGIAKYMLKKSFDKKYPLSFKEDKQKIPNQGKSHNIVYDIYNEKFMDLISSSNIQNDLLNKKLISEKFLFEKQNKKLRKNSIIYFRILSYLIWLENNKKII